MSLYLRRIKLTDFRKFREPLIIDGLTDGLNIVIEPNESGKSTLLEALRGVFFVRHGTKNQLAQSYAPHGHAVAPQVEVAFEADGAAWGVTKRFLKGAGVEVSGPQGRAQGEEAEARLHTLLGSVRDTSQKGDPVTYGALGLLWVAQAEALSVTAPGQIVRDTVRSTLEAEVGSIMGGPAYQRVRARVEEQFASYWTPTGQRRGRQTEARDRTDRAAGAAREASERLAALEQNFTDLEAAKARLRVLQRELADESDQDARKTLVAGLEVARSAAQILATRRAEQEAAAGRANALSDLEERHRVAVEALATAQSMVESATEQRRGSAAAVLTGRDKLSRTRAALDQARALRKKTRDQLVEGENQAKAAARRSAIGAARTRYEELVRLEQQHRDASTLAKTALTPEQLTILEDDERVVAEARAGVVSGAAVIALSGDPAGITIDGVPMSTGERTLTRETRLSIGAAELIIRPPTTAAGAELLLEEALRRQQQHFDELGASDLAAARRRNDDARDAAAEMRTLDARVVALTPAVPVLDLSAGAEALKLLIAELGPETDASTDASESDLVVLSGQAADAESRLAQAEGTHDSALSSLRSHEEDDQPLAAAEARAASDFINAQSQLALIEERSAFATLDHQLQDARERAAEAAVRTAEAEEAAGAHDVAAITRKIEIIDARARSAGESRTKLETVIARLEGIIESEGGKGLADRDAAAREEDEAARLANERVTEDAETLRLLREALDEANVEVAGRFVGPVARRAKRHIERILPGCDLTFSEDLGLETVVRGGLSEGCANLSRGTQEQLAVLTRIAFAELLLEQGRPVSLILDDPLVYSDDARLDLMVDILTETSERMQVILLTCRDRAFRHVAGHRIALAA